MIGHLLDQGPALSATLGLLLAGKGAGGGEAPGPWLEETVPVRPAALVRDFIAVCGGRPDAWAGRLPPTMFPQWGWPLITRALRGLPYPLARAVNAGCTWTVRGELPADQPLKLAARLLRIDDDGRRALLTVELRTGLAGAAPALESTLTAFVPLPTKGQKGEKKEPVRVPSSARPLATVAVPADQGWRFSLVSGDFNPIHWLGPYAKMAGFGGVILHGFGTAALAAERIIAERGGEPGTLRGMELRFTRPLRLPASLGLFTVADDEPGTALFAGAGLGEPAVLAGRFHV